MYRDQEGHESAGLCHDTGLRHGAGARVCALRLGRLGLRHGTTECHDTALTRAAWAHLGTQAGQGVHLCTQLVFGLSALFLSHCLGTVHEHCSQKKFEIFFFEK